MNRKYQNNQEIINTKGIKMEGAYEFYKIRIIRKAKPNKNDIYINYYVAVYYKKEDTYGITWIMTEKTIDEIAE